MPTKTIQFEGSQGDELQARLDRPTGPTRGCALFAHCFSCSKDTHAASRISRALAQRGIAVLRFDFTGLGQSGGDFSGTNFSTNVADLVAAAKFMESEHEPVSVLVGHSLGGAAVLAAAAELDHVAAVATINAPSDPEHVESHFGDKLSEIEKKGEAEVELAGRSFVIQKQFLDDIRDYDLPGKIDAMKKPVLVFHAPGDTTVSIEHARRIYEAAHHPKSFIAVDGADHLLSSQRDSEFVAHMLSAWLDRYLSDAKQRQTPTHQVVVSEAPGGKLVQEVRAGRHALTADEPESAGGDDAGPDPYAFLLAALGSCTSMTMRMYAEHKKLALDHVEVRLEHDRIHAEDCDDCESRDGRVDRIAREIRVEGDLDEAQRKRLLEIADKCPVHRTLKGEIIIRTSAVDR